jgi:hypothetical protein
MFAVTVILLLQANAVGTAHEPRGVSALEGLCTDTASPMETCRLQRIRQSCELVRDATDADIARGQR